MFSGLASGMTIKFFPLYFARQVWLQPVQTQFIYVALPFFMIVLSKAGQMVAKKVGRVVTSVGMAYIGSLALVSILYYHSNLGLNKPPTLSHLISCCIGQYWSMYYRSASLKCSFTPPPHTHTHTHKHTSHLSVSLYTSRCNTLKGDPCITSPIDSDES